MSDGAWNDPAVRRAVQEVIAAGPKPAYCGKCDKACRYVATYNAGYWVHADTGQFFDREPEDHDCNTYIVRGGSNV